MGLAWRVEDDPPGAAAGDSQVVQALQLRRPLPILPCCSSEFVCCWVLRRFIVSEVAGELLAHPSGDVRYYLPGIAFSTTGNLVITLRRYLSPAAAAERAAIAQQGQALFMARSATETVGAAVTRLYQKRGCI